MRVLVNSFECQRLEKFFSFAFALAQCEGATMMEYTGLILFQFFEQPTKSGIEFCFLCLKLQPCANDVKYFGIVGIYSPDKFVIRYYSFTTFYEPHSYFRKLSIFLRGYKHTPVFQVFTK